MCGNTSLIQNVRHMHYYNGGCVGLPEQGEGLGAGLDSCVLPTRHDGISIVQTTDLYLPTYTYERYTHIYVQHVITQALNLQCDI